MPFVWVNEPQIPDPTPPLSYGPNAVSTQVGVVANSVQVQPPPPCRLTYNTPNVGYDIVCFYDSLNVDQFNIGTLRGNNVNANIGQLNNSTIGYSTIDTATIDNLNVQYLFSNTFPTANMHLATKGYVDALIANSKPTGGNLQLLIEAAGDLLAGVADNTANRVPVGTLQTDILTVTPTVNTKVSWKSSIFPQGSSFRNLHIGTHRSFPRCNDVVQLFKASEIVMDDGTITTNWTTTSADIRINGAGGLDEGVALSNTWYEIYAIRNPTSNTRALMFHRSLDVRPHVSSNVLLPVNYTVSQYINTDHYVSTPGTLTPNVAQQFKSPITGKVRSAEVCIRVIGSPIGYAWLTVHDQELDGRPNSTILCESDRLLANEISFPAATSGIRTRFIFRNGVTLTANSKYCLMINTEYPQGSSSNPNYFAWMGTNIGGAFPDNEGNSIVYNILANTWITGNTTTPSGANNLYNRIFIESNNTPVVMPTGYTQKCLVSYALVEQFNSLREYSQRDRKITYAYSAHAYSYIGSGSVGSANYIPFGSILPNQYQQIHSIDIPYAAPPIPCIATFTSAFSASADLPLALGVVGSPGSYPQTTTFIEIEGQVRCNSSGGTSFSDIIGPVVVEEQCMNAIVYSTTTVYIISSLEF